MRLKNYLAYILTVPEIKCKQKQSFETMIEKWFHMPMPSKTSNRYGKRYDILDRYLGAKLVGDRKNVNFTFQLFFKVVIYLIPPPAADKISGYSVSSPTFHLPVLYVLTILMSM